jgi:GAF domain-containing protein
VERGAIEALHDLAVSIAAETELEAVLARVLSATEQLLGAVSSSAFLPARGRTHGRRFTTLETGQPHWQEENDQVRAGGMTDTVLREGRVVAIEDLQNWPNASPLAKALGSLSVLAAPMQCEGEAIGVFYANFAEQRRFTDAEVRLVEMLGAYAATALRNAQLIAAERRAVQRQAALLEMVRAVGASLDLRRVFLTMARHVRGVLGADEVSVHLLERDGRLSAVYQDPRVPEPERTHPIWEPDRFIREVIAVGQPRLKHRPVDDPETTPFWREHLLDVELAAVLPILGDGERLGLVIALWRRPAEMDASDLELLEAIVGHTAVAVQNARTHERAVAAARLDGAIKTAQSAAHELSQPLSVVVGYSELMADIEDPNDLRRFAGSIDRAAKELTRKVDQLRHVMRFVEQRWGSLDPILDLERSSEPDAEDEGSEDNLGRPRG